MFGLLHEGHKGTWGYLGGGTHSRQAWGSDGGECPRLQSSEMRVIVISVYFDVAEGPDALRRR